MENKRITAKVDGVVVSFKDLKEMIDFSWRMQRVENTMSVIKVNNLEVK